MTREREREYLGTGIADELISRFSEIPNVRVKAPVYHQVVLRQPTQMPLSHEQCDIRNCTRD